MAGSGIHHHLSQGGQQPSQLPTKGSARSSERPQDTSGEANDAMSEEDILRRQQCQQRRANLEGWQRQLRNMAYMEQQLQLEYAALTGIGQDGPHLSQHAQSFRPLHQPDAISDLLNRHREILATTAKIREHVRLITGAAQDESAGDQAQQGDAATIFNASQQQQPLQKPATSAAKRPSFNQFLGALRNFRRQQCQYPAGTEDELAIFARLQLDAADVCYPRSPARSAVEPARWEEHPYLLPDAANTAPNRPTLAPMGTVSPMLKTPSALSPPLWTLPDPKTYAKPGGQPFWRAEDPVIPWPIDPAPLGIKALDVPPGSDGAPPPSPLPSASATKRSQLDRNPQIEREMANGLPRDMGRDLSRYSLKHRRTNEDLVRGKKRSAPSENPDSPSRDNEHPIAKRVKIVRLPAQLPPFPNIEARRPSLSLPSQRSSSRRDPGLDQSERHDSPFQIDEDRSRVGNGAQKDDIWRYAASVAAVMRNEIEALEQKIQDSYFA